MYNAFKNDHLGLKMSRTKPLSDTQVKNAKPKAKDYKLADGDGLYLLVTAKGSKLWKQRYTLQGKSSTKAIGRYPNVSLATARKESIKIREMVSEGTKPTTSPTITTTTFKQLCEMYFEHRDDLGLKYIEDSKGKLKNHFYPVFGEKEIDTIVPTDIITCIREMNNKGLAETIRKSGSMLDRIFRYAVTLQLMPYNPMRDIDISVISKKRETKNFAHITDTEVFKNLLLDIDAYWGHKNVKSALQLMPYVFLRPANIRDAVWDEIDIEKKVWKIPAEKMKTKREHIVPLTDSMIEILDTMRENGSQFVFPSPQSQFKKMSENTLNVALQRMGYKGVMTSHGFRHTASTIINENSHLHGISADAIEMQLAHTVSGVRGVYNKAVYLEERVRLMQWWSDYLDGLKKEG